MSVRNDVAVSITLHRPRERRLQRQLCVDIVKDDSARQTPGIPGAYQLYSPPLSHMVSLKLSACLNYRGLARTVKRFSSRDRSRHLSQEQYRSSAKPHSNLKRVVTTQFPLRSMVQLYGAPLGTCRPHHGDAPPRSSSPQRPFVDLQGGVRLNPASHSPNHYV